MLVLVGTTTVCWVALSALPVSVIDARAGDPSAMVVWTSSMVRERGYVGAGSRRRGPSRSVYTSLSVDAESQSRHQNQFGPCRLTTWALGPHSKIKSIA